MIPKTIHYCWFGGNPLPELAVKCIESWKRICPDYEIIEWNEKNVDIASCPAYVREAYEAKKWGFVPDYIRVKLIHDNGGIYLDTDVELIKNLDPLLEQEAFFGFEDSNYINLGFGFGGVQNVQILKNIMSDYETKNFILDNGEYDLTPSPKQNAHVFREYGFILNNKTQGINNTFVYSTEYFDPHPQDKKRQQITENTYQF